MEGIQKHFEMYQDIILNVDLPAQNLRSGDIGTVVDCHPATGKEVGYSVEFFDMMGRAVGVVTLPGSSLRAPTSADRPSTRTLSATDA